MGKAKVLVGIVVAAVVLVVGGVWVYINVIKDDAPEKLAIQEPTTQTDFDGALTGDWVTNGIQQAGYRIAETLAGQATEGVGRTSQVDGTVTIDGTTITAATFTVDMASVRSDSDRRDGQYRDRLMETSLYPTSEFVLTEPIDLGEEPAEGTDITVEAVGELTLKQNTQPVTFELTARRTGGTISIVANYEIVFAEWGIEDPSNGFAQVGESGLLEISLELTKA